MTKSLEERIEAAAEALELCAGPLPAAARERYAEAVVRAAFPELFTDRPAAWVAPWEADGWMLAVHHESIYWTAPELWRMFRDASFRPLED